MYRLCLYLQINDSLVLPDSSRPCEMVLAEPLRVSPLIKTCRWTALLVGIWWGNKRWQANKATEDEHRAYVAKMQPIWDAEKAEKAAKVRPLHITGYQVF